MKSMAQQSLQSFAGSCYYPQNDCALCRMDVVDCIIGCDVLSLLLLLNVSVGHSLAAR